MSKNIFKIAAIVVAALFLVALALPLLIDVNHFRPEIESNLSSALGRQVTLGNLRLGILSASVQANRLSIADDPIYSSTPFIQAKSLNVGVELLPLIFSKRLSVTHLVLDHPQISLLRTRDGKWNFSSLANKSGAAPKAPAPGGIPAAPQNLSVGKLEIADATISLGSVPPRRAPVVYDKVNVSAKNFSFTTPFPVTISAALPGVGSLRLDAIAGPINPSDAALTPLHGAVQLHQLDLAQSALVNPETGIAGIADFDGKVNSDGHIATANGTVNATSLKLAPKGSPASESVRVFLSLTHDLQSETGQLTQADVTIGRAILRLSGTYNMQGENTSIHIKLTGQGMPLDDLQALLPAIGVTLPTGSKLKSGTLNMSFDAVGPVDKVVATGAIQVSNARLQGFNLNSKLSAIPGFGGRQSGNDTEIERLNSEVRYSHDGIRLDKLDVAIPSIGTATGSGTVSPDQRLDLKMIANLSGAVGGGLSKLVGMGSGGIPVTVGGTTSNPTFIPDLEAFAGNQIKNVTSAGKSLGKVTGLFGKKKK